MNHIKEAVYQQMQYICYKNFYYDRKDIMAGHVYFECYKYCLSHTCKGCEKRKESSC